MAVHAEAGSNRHVSVTRPQTGRVHTQPAAGTRQHHPEHVVHVAGGVRAGRDAVFARTWQVVGPRRAGREAGAVPHRRRRRRAGPGRARRRRRAARLLQRLPPPGGAGRAPSECGTATKLRCRYHGWTYDLAGNLRGTPEFDGVAGLPPRGQRPAAGRGRRVGAVRVGPPDAAARTAGRVPGSVAGVGGAAARVRRADVVAAQEYDLACNWKVYVDNYLDGGYHVNTVHPALAGVLDYTRVPHRVCDGNTVVAEQPDRSPARAPPAARATGDGGVLVGVPELHAEPATPA